MPVVAAVAQMLAIQQHLMLVQKLLQLAEEVEIERHGSAKRQRQPVRDKRRALLSARKRLPRLPPTLIQFSGATSKKSMELGTDAANEPRIGDAGRGLRRPDD